MWTGCKELAGVSIPLLVGGVLAYLFTCMTTYRHHHSHSAGTKRLSHFLSHTGPFFHQTLCRFSVSQSFQALGTLGSGGKWPSPQDSPDEKNLGMMYFSDSLPGVLNAKWP